MDVVAAGIDGDSMAVEVLNCCARGRDSRAGGSGAGRHAGALGRRAVGATVVVAWHPRLRVVVPSCCGRSGDVARVLRGQLVPGAVGPLHCRHPDARRGYDAQYEHQEPDDPGGPASMRSDHHCGTIGALAIRRNGGASSTAPGAGSHGGQHRHPLYPFPVRPPTRA